MNILIIGAKGFLGSSLLKFFRRKPEYRVWASDIVDDKDDSQYFRVDFESNNFDLVFNLALFDVCINCSGAANVAASAENPLKDFTLNAYNVFKILEAIRCNAPKCCLINLSSAAVYGNPMQLPIAESHNVNPISPYGSHKLYAENICNEYHQYFRINSISLRIFSAYGPGLKKQIFWDIYQKSILSDEISLLGSGNETRDFIFVDDISLALHTLITKTSLQHGIYNLATGIETSISEAADKFLQILQWKGKVSFTGRINTYDPVNWRADVTKLKELGWKPEVSLENGLKKYAEWVRGLN